MKSLVVLISLFCLYVQAVEIPELTAEQLLDIAHGDTEDTWFIKFYGPNCGFCTSMAEEWQAFADEVDAEGLDIKVGQYNVHDNEKSINEVKNFFPGPLPGLHLFPPHDKKFYEFPNPRINIRKEFYIDFALFEYETYEGVYRKPEYLYQEDSPVVSIDGQVFDKFLVEHRDQPLFVFFFGPKCGWCKQKMPLWTQFAKESLEKGAPWIVARTDGFSNMQIIERYNARPWPSMVYIESGKYYRLDTDEGRSIESTGELFSWIESGEYLDVSEEYTGDDEGFQRYLKVEAAKEKSRQRKKQREQEEL